MPLSRHFYSLDEVQAALQYETSRRNSTEALFWCQELILSGCVGEAISTLFLSWLWNTGSIRLQWLIDAWTNIASDELSEDDILLATYRLGAISTRDSSLWNILVLVAQNPDTIPDRITRKTPSVLPSDDPKEVYFVRAIFQGKAAAAWWIAQYIDSDRVWELLAWVALNVNTRYSNEYNICLKALKCYDQLLGYKSTGYDVIVLCTAVIMMSLRPQKQEESFRPLASEIDRHNLQTLNEWSTAVGHRERRIYQIPTSCLYGSTLRGRSKWAQNNYTQLYNIEKHLVGCPFWDDVLTEYATVGDSCILWHSDDKMEEFYEKYFPDDIPDEWSKKDQQKSHGDGVLSPTDKPNIWKYSRNFMARAPYFAWNTTKYVNTYLEKVDISDCSLERIIEYYDRRELSEENLKKLKAVHKIKIV